eukprot:6212411-Pleurochrysis_carterae.AAC.5
MLSSALFRSESEDLRVWPRLTLQTESASLRNVSTCLDGRLGRERRLLACQLSQFPPEKAPEVVESFGMFLTRMRPTCASRNALIGSS